MKKLTAISLFIFWALVVSLLVSGLVVYQNNKQPGLATGSNATGLATQTLSIQELSKHTTASSCWLLIDAKIYDVTSYIYQHPGNANTIIPTCGTDATKAYDTKGRVNSPSPHSQNAHELLKAYYIGNLGQAASAITTQAATPPVAPAKPATAGASTIKTIITLSLQEIARHNTTSNCWLIINGNVYNVTGYLIQHPGGVSAVKPYCGGDGTAAFEGLPHSTNAHQLLANFLVGAVGQKTTIQTIQQTAAPTIPAGATQTRAEDD